MPSYLGAGREKKTHYQHHCSISIILSAEVFRLWIQCQELVQPLMKFYLGYYGIFEHDPVYYELRITLMTTHIFSLYNFIVMKRIEI